MARTFDMTMKATKDIKVASEREKIETFIDLCSDNKLYVLVTLSMAREKCLIFCEFSMLTGFPAVCSR